MKGKMKWKRAAALLLFACVFFCVAATACGETPADEHRLTKAAAKAATCEEAGNTEYYTCSHCDKLFADAEASREIDAASVVVSPLGHDFTVARHNDTAHWNECSRCGTPDVRENHTGGTATHTEAAVCEVCGVAYGDPIGHTFDRKVASDAYLKSAATCTAKAVYYKSCSCGAAGTETFESGELAAHSFTVARQDETAHWNECAVCGASTERQPHTGGTATCTAQAVCGICGTPYGAPAAHVFDREVAEDAYLASAADCTAPAVYYKSCVCGAKGTETFTAGTALGHDEQWQSDESGHWLACSRCGLTSEKAAHTPNAEDWNETDQVCTVCGSVLHASPYTALAEPVKLNISTDWPTSTLTVKNLAYTPSVIEYGGASHEASLFTFNGSVGDLFFLRGGGLPITGTGGVRYRVGYYFRNENPTEDISFHYNYEKDGYIPGTTGVMTVPAGETVYVEFPVDMNFVAKDTITPYVRLILDSDVTDARLAFVGYKLGEYDGSAVRLRVETANGTVDRYLDEGYDCAAILSGLTLPDGALGWYNAGDPMQKWLADGENGVTIDSFPMPAADVTVRPIVLNGSFAPKNINPRKTGASDYMVYDSADKSHRGDVTTDGEYSAQRALYTVVSSEKDTQIISACGNHIGNSTANDRLVKMTFTRVSGDISFTHWVERGVEEVKTCTTFDVTLDEAHPEAVVLFIVPKGMLVNSNNEANFYLKLLQDMTGDASFVMTCEVANLA